ncbi:hypothetical protein [Xanthomonas phage JGB6]|nr:hypothetical protein [Xanthomonas phage JGB6]
MGFFGAYAQKDHSAFTMESYYQCNLRHCGNLAVVWVRSLVFGYQLDRSGDLLADFAGPDASVSQLTLLLQLEHTPKRSESIPERFSRF